jgi:dTMP kinase
MKRLIVVDGLDGCGKDTHARRIKQLMESEGIQTVIVSHPSNRRFGRMSKKALQGSGHVSRALATLFYTLDVLGSVREFNRRREGTVIFVRYLLGTAYLPQVLAPTGYRLFRNLLPFPDLALFIDTDPEVALRRIEMRDHRREMFETLYRLRAVRTVAQDLTRGEWTVLDNNEDGEGPFRNLEEILRTRGFIR